MQAPSATKARLNSARQQKQRLATTGGLRVCAKLISFNCSKSLAGKVLGKPTNVVVLVRRIHDPMRRLRTARCGSKASGDVLQRWLQVETVQEVVG
jgi:hypothetical protein